MTRIELAVKEEFYDPEAQSIVAASRDLGIDSVESVCFYRVYYLLGDLAVAQKAEIAQKLLADRVVDNVAIDEQLNQCDKEAPHWTVEITYNRGVTDLVAQTANKGIKDLGIAEIQEVKTARRYEFVGKLTGDQKAIITEKLLMNKVIEHVLQPDETIFFPTREVPFEPVHVPLAALNEQELQRLSKERDLFLNLQEMKTIQTYYDQLGRDPSDVELEMLAQTWSEHCSHKTLTGLVDYEGKTIDNLLKQTIFRVTRELDKPWCVSVFKDNAGIIRFDDTDNVCFKVETHNHPSAMEPYGGANTGIGGVIRDPLGTGLGAKPVMNTDVFCFGPVDIAHKDVPKGVLHPKRVMQGVVAGVRDYGNRMGIPTLNGSIFFDDRYIGNPLVFCGNIGIMPKDKCEKNVVAGDAILVVGGRTGRDGIHGATASSGELHSESEGTWSGAVQIGNPIVEKKLVDTLLKARDQGLYRAITDCGAGGLSSAIGELAETTGARVDLDKVPLKYHGLTYMEIWISEAQERMVIFVPPENVERALSLFAGEDVEATVIGHTTDDRVLRLYYNGTLVGEMEMAFLHDGMPRLVRKATWEPVITGSDELPEMPDLNEALNHILAAPNVCSKEWVIRQYDHEVQGGSVLKPLVGVKNDGPGDASITRPRLDSHRAIAVSNGLNPKYGLVDPYWMAASAIDEAIRNIVAVGGNLERTALLDNFCWGNTDKPDRLGGLVRAARACYDLAKVYKTPFISGKDSLNNEFQNDAGETIAIPPTLLISAISVMPDARKAVSMDLKKAGNSLYLVGRTLDELGGSHYGDYLNIVSDRVPKVDPEEALQTYRALLQAMQEGLVRACHDCSEGGIGVAAAEMAFAGGTGLDISLQEIPGSEVLERDDIAIFSESNSRFLVEVEEKNGQRFDNLLSDCACKKIGRVMDNNTVKIRGLNGIVRIEQDMETLKQSWQKTLGW
ncbi:phosphoribosylformylglycinamidine synthase subunit PurL [candidate division KSB1 bacterium]|nr:phosphoribosylformylglycinamidine synthase subunit PurL [candidate division KSB1 bacterium]